MLTPLTTLGTYGGPAPAPPEGVVPVTGPVTILAFTLPIAGPVPNIILPPAPQSCQNSCPNVALQVLVVDQDAQPVDLSTATNLQLWLLDPAGIATPVPAAFVSNGMDGLIQFITSAEDLPERGLWQVQAQMSFGANLIATRWASFQVDANVVDL